LLRDDGNLNPEIAQMIEREREERRRERGDYRSR
jgi:hypothetical protein